MEEMGVDKYAKKLYSIELIELIAHAQLELNSPPPKRI
jgi:hypothetical protein